MSLHRNQKSETTTREKWPQKGVSASELSVARFGRLCGGRTGARTWDPLVTWLGPISRRPVSEEYRLFRVRVERSDSGHLTRTGPDGGGEALLRLRQFLPVVRVEAVFRLSPVRSITIWIAMIALLGLPMARSLDPVTMSRIIKRRGFPLRTPDLSGPNSSELTSRYSR